MVMWQLTIDANDPARLVRFWAPLLGYEVQPPPPGFDSWIDWYRSKGVPEEELAGDPDDLVDRIHDPSGRGPNIWFQIVPEEKAGKNRLHLDLTPIDCSQADEVARLEALGAHRVDIGQGQTKWVVLADPEGNEFCVLRSLAPGEFELPAPAADAG